MMHRGVVVDACALASAYEELVQDSGARRDDIERVLDCPGIAMDDGGRIENQWLSTKPGSFMARWVAENFRCNRLKLVPASLPKQHAKHLCIRLGFPKADTVYVGTANATEDRYILTEDIDFYNPCLKSHSPKEKNACKLNRAGPVCRYLKKALGVAVGDWQNFHTDIVARSSTNGPTSLPSESPGVATFDPAGPPDVSR